jgi:two-component system, LytTR family, response regulator
VIRTIIVDDEELARRGVRSRLQSHDDIEIVAECKNGREAIDAIRRLAPDLVFLDVQMPGKNGFDVLDALGTKSLPYVVFLTAHDQYALRAFEVRALDYLLKPIDDERFTQTLARVRESLDRDRGSHLGKRVAALLEEVRSQAANPQPEADRILVRSGGRVVFVKTKDIDWIEAAGDYVSLHTGKREWLLRETVASIEKRLAPLGFARIHRSTIVNPDRIVEMETIDNGEYLVILRDGTRLRLSRNFRHTLPALMQQI